jgi:hypothetical protein
MKYTTVVQARMDLGARVAEALSNAEEFMREAEAQHAKVAADPFFTDADRRASLTEVLLSHRAIGLLRHLAEMLPAPPEDAPLIVPTAHRIEHPPKPGWSRAPAEVMGGTVGGLAHSLLATAGCQHFDLHVSDSGAMHVFYASDHPIARLSVFHAFSLAFGKSAFEVTLMTSPP